MRIQIFLKTDVTSVTLYLIQRKPLKLIISEMPRTLLENDGVCKQGNMIQTDQ